MVSESPEHPFSGGLFSDGRRETVRKTNSDFIQKWLRDSVSGELKNPGGRARRSVGDFHLWSAAPLNISFVVFVLFCFLIVWE